LQVLERFSLKDNYYEVGWGAHSRPNTKKKKGKHRGMESRSKRYLKWHPFDVEEEFLPSVERMREEVAAEVAASLETELVRVRGRTLTLKELKTHNFSQGVLNRRMARLQQAWAEQQPSLQKHLPPVLLEDRFKEQRERALYKIKKVPFQERLARRRAHLEQQQLRDLARRQRDIVRSVQEGLPVRRPVRMLLPEMPEAYPAAAPASS
jgi:hypothetical protein